jgi:hypothetical protein
MILPLGQHQGTRMDDKRIRPRMHRRIPIRIDFRYEGAHDGTGTLLEMSEGGMSFVTGATVPIDSTLTFHIADDEDAFFLDGVVVYSRSEKGDSHCGVQFISPSPAARISIRDFLKRNRFKQFRMPG